MGDTLPRKQQTTNFVLKDIIFFFLKTALKSLEEFRGSCFECLRVAVLGAVGFPQTTGIPVS